MNHDQEFGIQTVERFVHDIEQKVEEIQEGLYYIKQWLTLMKENRVSLLNVKSYRGRSR